MLVGNSLPEYVFTRVAVWGLRSVAPISIIFCSCIVYVAPLGTPLSHPWLIPPYVWMVGEAAFYLGCYLPLRRYFQRPVVHPPPPSKAEREVLFQRIRKNITEPNSYISKWFMNARIEDIKWENLKQFFSWSLMNRRYGLSPKSDTYESIDNDQDQELNGYLELLEQDFGRWFDRGLGKAKCLRGTFDEVLMQHRPLLWYGVSRPLKSLREI